MIIQFITHDYTLHCIFWSERNKLKTLHTHAAPTTTKYSTLRGKKRQRHRQNATHTTKNLSQPSPCTFMYVLCDVFKKERMF